VKKTICLDFDGVIHSYTSGWQGEEIINDPPIFGTRDSIIRLREMGFTILIHSCRCRSATGRLAIEEYFLRHDIKVDGICEHKPQADFYVDDRGIKFDGVWDEVIEQIAETTGTIQVDWDEITSSVSTQKNNPHNNNTENDSHNKPTMDDKTVKMLNELFKDELIEANYPFEDDEEEIIH
jgi:hypothetical protein